MHRRFEDGVIFTLLLLASGAGVGVYTGSQTTGGGLGIQLVLGVIYLCVFAFLVQRVKPALSLATDEKWMMGICILALASVVWSVEPGETLRRSIAFMATTGAGLYIGMRYEPKDQVKLIAACAAIGAFASLAICLMAPDIGLTPHKEWQGIYFPKNSLARMMVLGVMSFAWLAMRQRRRRVLHICMILFCLFMMVMADSATGIVVSAVMLLALPFRRVFALRPRQLILISIVAVLIAAPIGLWNLAHVDDITAALSRNSTLTGRLPLWHTVRIEIMTRPVLGFGYSAFWSNWRADQDRRIVNWAAPNAHSGFLEFALGLGFVGLALFLIGLLRNLYLGAKIAGASRDVDNTWPIFFFLFFGILYNLVETTIGIPNSLYTILYTANSYWLVRMAVQPASEAATERVDERAAESLPGFTPAET